MGPTYEGRFVRTSVPRAWTVTTRKWYYHNFDTPTFLVVKSFTEFPYLWLTPT